MVEGFCYLLLGILEASCWFFGTQQPWRQGMLTVLAILFGLLLFYSCTAGILSFYSQ